MAAGDTIYALSSGQGRAGVAVVRLSGPGCRTALEAIAGGCPPARFAALRLLRDPATREPIDQALVLRFEAPRSETGEDMAEFQVHGSRAVLAALFRALASLPATRPAEPGEFARRAFVNGKLDLTSVEALGQLIEADTDRQRRQALSAVQGDLRRTYEAWRTALISAMAEVEAAIDFADEADVEASRPRSLRTSVAATAAQIRAHLAGADRGEIVRDGFRVVLAGAPNVGKSSLLNALARRDVAIVSAEAGTTRDALEVRLDLAGLSVLLIDTAGLRDTANAVEQEGIRRTLARSREADLVILVEDARSAGQPLPQDLASVGEAGRLMRVANKADLLAAGPGPATADRDARSGDGDQPLLVSAATGSGLAVLIDAIARRAEHAAGDPGASVPITERQRAALVRAVSHLDMFLSGDDGELELRAEDLRLAAHALATVTGHIDAEQVLDQIFAAFCIGK